MDSSLHGRNLHHKLHFEFSQRFYFIFLPACTTSLFRRTLTFSDRLEFATAIVPTTDTEYRLLFPETVRLRVEFCSHSFRRILGFSRKTGFLHFRNNSEVDRLFSPVRNFLPKTIRDYSYWWRWLVSRISIPLYLLLKIFVIWPWLRKGNRDGSGVKVEKNMI